MTYQKQTQTHDDDNVDEASSLFLTVVTASPAPSFSLGQEGMPATKKNGALMRAMIATCFLLTTIAVIYGGSDSSSSSNSRAVGSSDALLLRQKNQAAKLYAPSTDFCYKLINAVPDQYCWYISNSLPYGNWEQVPSYSHGNNNCGPLCTTFEASNGGSEACDDDHYGQCNPSCKDYGSASDQSICSF